MSFTPLLTASASIQIHLALALLALGLGTTVIFLKKGTPKHKTIGMIWSAVMYGTALSSFAVTSLLPGHFSPIHILSLVTLATLPLAILARRRGDIKGHARIMLANYAGLVIAGMFTLIPGRLLGQVVFGW